MMYTAKSRMTMFKYAEPMGKLRDYIAFFWQVEVNHEPGESYAYNYIATSKPVFLFRYCGEHVKISGTDQSFIHQASIVGQSETYTNYQVLSDRTSFFGVRFYPWVLPELFGICATELTNGSLDILSLLGREGDRLVSDMLKSAHFDKRIEIISTYLSAKIQNPSKKFLQAQQSIVLIHSNEAEITVDELVQRAHISERQFERNFKTLTGFSARTYLKIIKFERALKNMKNSIHRNDLLTSIALDSGYYDQAHFNRHFRQFTGKSPLNHLNSHPY
ncbi:helix-turn-helix transcriptional regulator [Sphingobacterium sp. N143]|uniref:helix-turn-helix domain-containing protein n=1 Tax=Sphingobacterium sp. N143 TaxID=2746727 RepID=UPI002575CE62|nr:AraC family transcriptional regulator [Sphingobacterium sp. N143]MDM1295283.1 helix-turn-helix transcriptional regulator [Sphingobacterium sp. N143]